MVDPPRVRWYRFQQFEWKRSQKRFPQDRAGVSPPARFGERGHGVTIKDVAQYCGVSISTVSRVLNNHPDVSEEVREKVLDAVRTLHYTPNKSAQDLVRTQADGVGLVVRGATNPFYTPIIRSITSTAESEGYAVVMHQIATNGAELEAAAELANSKRLRGVVLLGGRYDYTKDEAAALTVPFVCCTYTNHYGDLDPQSYSSVAVDDRLEGYRATKMLVERGHRRIAILLDSTSSHSVSERRYKGYGEALAEAGLPLDSALVAETGDFEMATAYQRVCDLVASGSKFTAIFCVADSMAIAAMKALADCGLAVPGDVSVLAIDGIDMSLYTIPTLSTFCQPQETIGRTAAEILNDLLRGRSGNRHVRLGTTLRPGGTVRSLQ